MKPSLRHSAPSRFNVRDVFAVLTVCFLGACCQLYADAQTDAQTDSQTDAQAASPESRSPHDDVIAYDAFDDTLGSLRDTARGIGWKQPWRVSRASSPMIVKAAATPADASRLAVQRALQIHELQIHELQIHELQIHELQIHELQIHGTGSRNNPLRRELMRPLSQLELFVRFTLHYAVDQVKSSEVDPEFFVLWLDRLDGGDRATHAANVPNIGVHLADRGPKKGKNVFMVRIGPAQTAWSKVELQKNRTYQVVGRLSKSEDGARADYDRFDLFFGLIRRKQISIHPRPQSRACRALVWCGGSAFQPD